MANKNAFIVKIHPILVKKIKIYNKYLVSHTPDKQYHNYIHPHQQLGPLKDVLMLHII